MSIMTGEHCSLNSCGALSFLPMRCECCRKLYCELHAVPERHSCDVMAQTTVNHDSESATTAPSRTVCTLRGCKMPTLHVPGASIAHAAPRCVQCNGIFCMAHRSPRSHGCSAPSATAARANATATAAEARRAAARAALARNFPDYKGKSMT